MLRIPGAEDTPPLLLRSMRSVTDPSQSPANQSESASLEAPKVAVGKLDAGFRLWNQIKKRSVFPWLLAGAAIIAVGVFGVILSMPRKNLENPSIAESSLSLSATDPERLTEKSQVRKPLTDLAFISESEPMVKKFMEATDVEGLLPLVRNPELAERRMRRFYPDGKISASGMSAFNMISSFSHEGSIWTVIIRTQDFEEKPIFFVETGKELKIDWESWVGWSEVSWSEFLSTKSSVPKQFRVRLSMVDYYNFAFTDEKKWQSYFIESPDGRHSIYGYVEKESLLNSRLQFAPEVKMMNLTLMLKFPEDAKKANQLIIDKVISEGWVLEDEPSP